jgi:hypothetical protein
MLNPYAVVVDVQIVEYVTTLAVDKTFSDSQESSHHRFSSF